MKSSNPIDEYIFEITANGNCIVDQWYSDYLGDVRAKSKEDALRIAKSIPEWENEKIDSAHINWMKSNGFQKDKIRLFN